MRIKYVPVAARLLNVNLAVSHNASVMEYLLVLKKKLLLKTVTRIVFV